MPRIFRHWCACAYAYAYAYACACACALVVLAPLCTATAAGATDGIDASHGRIEGDLQASASVGATFGPRGPRAAADLRLRYLWTAGVFITYEDGALVGGNTDPRRALATGIELRPLFFARWLQGRESGNTYFDLTVDSISFELGAVFLEPPGTNFGIKPGLQAGMGIALPLLPNATGPVIGLHGGARWSDAALSGHDIDGPSDRALFFLVTLGWQQMFGGGIVDIGDRAPR